MGENGMSAEAEVKVRAEVEAPFRAFRLVIFGFLAASAGLATLFVVPQLIGALGGAPNAKPLEAVLTDLGIDLGALSLLLFLVKRDVDAREARYSDGREEKTPSRRVWL